MSTIQLRGWSPRSAIPNGIPTRGPTRVGAALLSPPATASQPGENVGLPQREQPRAHGWLGACQGRAHCTGRRGGYGVGSGNGQAEMGPPIGRGEGRQPLPLAAASIRLRGKPGRPAREDGAPARPTVAPSPLAGAAAGHGRAPSQSTPGRVSMAVAPLHPRVLDLHAAAAYLGLRERKLRELAHSGILPRVRIPLPHDGEVRKLLFDRVDLDRLIEVWKDRREIGEA